MGSTDGAFTSVTQVLSGYRSDFRLIAGDERARTGETEVERFLLFPAVGTPRLLLPTDGPALSTGLKGFLGAHRGSSLAPPLVRLTSKIGNAASRLNQQVALLSQAGEQSPVRTLIADVLGRQDFELAFRMSVGRPNAKTVVLAISPDGEPLCFAKFGSESLTNSLVQYEGQILTRFQNFDMPVLVPQVLRTGVWAGDHHVLVTKALNVKPLVRDAIDAHRATDAFSTLNGVTTQPLTASSYWQRATARITALSDDAQTGDQLQLAHDVIERRWGSMEFDFGLAHGDWSRPNLGRNADGRLIALDWERCMENAPRGIDVAHFAIIENSSSAASRMLNLDKINDHARHYLDEIGRSPLQAEPLIVLDLLEMVLRFTQARKVGIPSKDSIFGSALHASIL